MCSNVKCKTCQYRAAEQADNGCDYYLITGKLRGCSIDECDKCIEGEKIVLKSKMNAEIRQGWLRGTWKGVRETNGR